MRRQRLVIEVEGDPAGLSAPIYSLDIVKDILFDDLAVNGWRVISYGDESESGCFKCYPDSDGRRKALRERLHAESRAQAEAVRKSLKKRRRR